MKLIVLFMLSVFSISCQSQQENESNKLLNDTVKNEIKYQISEYVTGVYEDSKGNLWFGTIHKGIAKYDGNELQFYTKKDGLLSNRVTGIIEDAHGTFWLKTGAGLARYDGNSFTTISGNEDLSPNTISVLLIDSRGTFWVGSWAGVFIFDGKNFKHFPIPKPKVETIINEDTKDWITEIKEDSEGNIWFGRDGYGACKYDGESFTHFLKKDGLHSNNVTEIEFDLDGNVWFGTRVAEKDNPVAAMRSGNGGINQLTKNGMISFPEIEGFNHGDVYEIYKDNLGNIWISTMRNGLYQFNGKKFIHHDVSISVMSMTDDQKGNLWLGGAGGLYRINKNGDISNITTKGPWE